MDQKAKIPTVQNTADNALEDSPKSEEVLDNGEYFGNILQRRMKRRTLLKGASALSVGLVMSSSALMSSKARAADRQTANNPGFRLQFTPIEPSSADMVIVPPNYSYNVLIKWGDPLFPEHQNLTLSTKRGKRRNCSLVSTVISLAILNSRAIAKPCWR